MNISLETAERLFEEANDFFTGKVHYLAGESEIRQIAKETFGRVYLSHLSEVCAEIFRVLAEDSRNYWSERR